MDNKMIARELQRIAGIITSNSHPTPMVCKGCGGDEPNFRYKPTGFEVTWYKYIGRDMKHRPISSEEVAEMRKKLF